MLKDRIIKIKMFALGSHRVLGMLLTFLLTSQVFSQQDKEQKQIKLIFAGDIMCHETQLSSAYDSVSDSYSFDSYFESVNPLIQSADMAFANLETTFPGAIFSGYPAFGSPDNLLSSIKSAGFDCLFTANNHSLDKGHFGLERTINMLNINDILHTGTFGSQEEKDLTSPLLINLKGKIIALINYTYGINSGHLPNKYLINTIDTIAILRDINKSQEAKADMILCFLHWGKEYNESQSSSQEHLSNWLHAHGVKLVIGSHPHVVQPVVTYQTDNAIVGITAYSLGNLISNQRTGKRKNGLILEVNLTIVDNKLEILNFIEHPTYVERSAKNKSGYYNYLITLPSLPSPTSQTAGL